MNTKGISFVETLLTVAIIMLIATTIIPLSFHFNETLNTTKRDLHASHVAYNAAKQIIDTGMTTGVEMIEKVNYKWTFDGEKLCVQYQIVEEVTKKCLSQQGVL